jgi:hypothetical protein
MDWRDNALTFAIRNRSWRSGAYDERQPITPRRQGEPGGGALAQQQPDSHRSERDSGRTGNQDKNQHRDRRAE